MNDENSNECVLQILCQHNIRLNIKNEPEYQDIEYQGEKLEINDLITHLTRKFKKYYTNLGFDIKIKDELLSYTEDLITEGMYALKKVQTPTDAINLFYFISTTETINFGITDTIVGLLSTTNVDYNNSFLIKGEEKVVIALNESMKMDFGFSNTEGIPFDLSIVHLLQIKLNILLKNNKVIFLNLALKLNSIAQLLTSTEVCDILHISKQTLSVWRKTNKIKFTKKSERIYLYRKSDVMSLVDILSNHKKKTLDSNEVCEILNISKQVLMYWRKMKKIKYKVISKRNIRYDMYYIQEILTTKLLMTDSNKKVTTINTEEEILDWITSYSHKVTKKSYQKQLFFLNFGNVDISSSPQVMISNDYMLIDVIHSTTIIDNPPDLLVYLQGLDEKSLNPSIDTSKEYYDGFKELYLNKLFNGR